MMTMDLEENRLISENPIISQILQNKSIKDTMESLKSLCKPSTITQLSSMKSYEQTSSSSSFNRGSSSKKRHGSLWNSKVEPDDSSSSLSPSLWTPHQKTKSKHFVSRENLLMMRRKKTSSHHSTNFPPFSGSSKGSFLSKNRMGQRARRQLWENIYGSNAKHLKYSKETKKLTNHHPYRSSSSKSLYTGSSSSNPSRKVLINNKSSSSSSSSLHDRSTTSLKNHLIPNDLSIHPSWKAKKVEQQQSNIKPFLGTKLVFTDDDDTER